MTSSSGYKNIGDYGLIGDRHSAALVSIDGAIDWCTFPRFDSPSVFAAILDAEKGGRFAITPPDIHTGTQRYLPDSNVLETQFVTHTGACTVTDFMPFYRHEDGRPTEFHSIVRMVRCREGTVSLQVDYQPRPDYGRSPVTITSRDGALVVTDGDAALVLRSSAPLDIADGHATGALDLAAGDEAVFVLSYVERPPETDSQGVDLPPKHLLDHTLAYWRDRAHGLEYQGPWREQVVRSYLALHLLTHVPTGGIVAAPTTSLPEWVGGVRNWDYRYTWLRDAAFTIDALLKLGHHDEALTFFHWLGRVCGLDENHVHVLYRVDAAPDVDEGELPHLEGHRRSSPVRIGNGAFHQVQHDIYGEILASAYLLAQRGEAIGDGQWEVLRAIAHMAATRWQEPDSGIWEVRGGPFHFVYSKAMCWVALDRAISLAELTGREEPQIETWREAAEAIKDDVLRRGWSERKRAFVQHYDSEAMDASNLLLPLMGFLPFDDPRVASTVDGIRRELGEGPFLLRYRTEETDDGVFGQEGAFILCSFWLVQVLARTGQVEEARRLFTELLGYANHLGLFGEMADPRTGVVLGNFPQAFTHIGLILAARECAIADTNQVAPAP